jgi:signal peptidase II
MNTKRIVRNLIIIMLLGTTIGCDQVSKIIVRNHVAEYERIGLIAHYFTLTKVENTGAFLSLGQTLPPPLKLLLLVILPLLALGFSLVYLFFKTTLSSRRMVGICFIIGGGIGNIYDRMAYGSVTDFLHIDLGIVQTGIFNIADVAVMAGIILLFLETTLERTKVNPDEEIESQNS